MNRTTEKTPVCKPPILDNRLTMTAALIPENAVVADIGTDHAYLPCFLVNNGMIPSAIASDVADGPMENAKKTVEKYGLADKITVRKSDGLQNIRPAECTCIVLAGMGGNLICDILSAAPWSHEKYLVLQPMTHSQDVRQFLCEHSFAITDEQAVLDGDKVYIAFAAKHMYNNLYNDDIFYYWFGSYYKKDDAASHAFVARQIKRLRDRLSGLQKTNAMRDEYNTIQALLNDKRLEAHMHDNSR